MRTVALPLVVAVLAAGCGGAPPPIEEVPVAEASAVPFEDSGLTAPSTPPVPTPSPSPAAAPSPAPSPAAPSAPEEPTGPTSADAAAFIAQDDPEGVSGLEHVVVDLDGDDADEVVATGVRDGVGWLQVAWWGGDAFSVGAQDLAGPGPSVTDVHVADVNRDGVRELLLTVAGDGRRSLALWAVPGRDRLRPLEAVGGCNDGSHVYGVTRARLEQAGDEQPVVVVADCDESPLPVADWAEQRWVWTDGAYRHQPAPPPDGDGGDDEEQDDGKDKGNGNGRGRGDDDDD